MKRTILFSVLIFSAFAHAGPTFTAGPYTVQTGIPTVASMTVDGVAAKVACTLALNASNQTNATCDLSTLTTPGNHVLIFVAGNATASCIPDGLTPPNWDCSSGGTSSYGPFNLTLHGALAAPTSVKLVP